VSREPDLIWLRPEATPRGQRPALSRAEITRAAVELADEDGLQAVSMRRVAARLGAGAMSLYWYVNSKEDLHELMADAVIGEIELPDRRSGDWRTDLRVLAVNTHAVLSRHSWMVLLGIQPGLGPGTRRYAEFARAAIADLGADPWTLTNVLAVLNNYLFGFAHRETAWRELRRRTGLSDESWEARMRDYVDSTAAGDAAVARLMAERLELRGERSFEFGLDCVLGGISARLAMP
jgi:AcrR family transcriptional regulator